MSTGTVVPVPIQVNVVKQNIGGQDRAFVVPPGIHIGIGASKVPSIQLTNSTGAPVRVWFPNGGQLFDAPLDFSNPLDVPAGGLTLHVKSSPNPGDYHYHVYCEAVKDCAQGNSEPKVGCP
jgi:hypothetical protein